MMKQFIDHILSMRAAIVVSAICLCAVTAAAQSKGKFSPEKYQAELEQFITSEAGLSAQEAADFFPLLREMQEKQRAIYNQLKAAARTKPADENGCKKAKAALKPVFGKKRRNIGPDRTLSLGFLLLCRDSELHSYEGDVKQMEHQLLKEVPSGGQIEVLCSIVVEKEQKQSTDHRCRDQILPEESDLGPQG